jgi:hypothetical protein
VTRDEWIACEERAAIMEYLGGLPRTEAERMGMKIVEGRGGVAEQMELLKAEAHQTRRR